MTTLLKHLKSDEMPPCAHMPSGLPIAPTMQAIVVDGVPIVNPQLAAVIGDNAEAVMACPEDSQAASPPYSKLIATMEPRPSSTCVSVVHHLIVFQLVLTPHY